MLLVMEEMMIPSLMVKRRELSQIVTQRGLKMWMKMMVIRVVLIVHRIRVLMPWG
jgi:hypothetical protein